MKVVALCPELTPTIVARNTRSEEREDARVRTDNNTLLSGPEPDQLDLTCFHG